MKPPQEEEEEEEVVDDDDNETTKTKKKKQLRGLFSISVSPFQFKGNNCGLNNVWNRSKFKPLLMSQNLWVSNRT